MPETQEFAPRRYEALARRPVLVSCAWLIPPSSRPGNGGQTNEAYHRLCGGWDGHQRWAVSQCDLFGLMTPGSVLMAALPVAFTL